MHATKVYGPYTEQRKHRTAYRVVVARPDGASRSRKFDTLAAAEAYADSARGQTSGVTVSDSITAYVEDMRRRELKPATIERAENHLRNLLDVDRNGKRSVTWVLKQGQALYDACQIRDVDPEDGAITRYSVATHRGALAAGRSWASYCRERGWLRADPFELVKGVGRRNWGRAKPQLRVDEGRTLTDFLLARCTPVVEPAAVAVLAALLLGPRATEVVARDVRDLDDGGRLLWIPTSKTANGRRELEVPEVLRPLLLELARDKIGAAPLFVSERGRSGKGARVTRSWLYYHCKRLCRLAGVPVIGPHGMRRSHGSIARRGGATGELVAGQLGHGSVAVQERSYVAPGSGEAAAAREVELRLVKGGRS